MEHEDFKKEDYEKKIEETKEEKGKTKKRFIPRFLRVTLDDILDFLAGEKRPPAKLR
jgi:hypothetical protein